MAIVDSRGSVTYGEFCAAVAGFAARLHKIGLAKGERVALWDTAPDITKLVDENLWDRLAWGA